MQVLDHVAQSPSRTRKKIESKISSKVVLTITPESIADYLGYRAPLPHRRNYPRGAQNPIDRKAIVDFMFSNPDDFKGTLKPGLFKEEIRLMSKVIHANLYPRGNDSRLTEKAAEVIYAFCQPDTVCNWAEFIFGQLVDFMGEVRSDAKMPFACMITAMVNAAGATGPNYRKKEPLNPGPIDAHQMKKSDSLSKPTSSGSQTHREVTTAPPANSSNATWFKKLFCQNVAIWNKTRKLEKKAKEAEHERNWQTRQIELAHGVKYVKEPVVMSSDEEAEEELEEPVPADEDE